MGRTKRSRGVAQRPIDQRLPQFRLQTAPSFPEFHYLQRHWRTLTPILPVRTGRRLGQKRNLQPPWPWGPTEA